jgi:poly [ADP-ribose] polymerase
MKKVKLIMVTDINNNKYYNMEQLDQYEFKVTYGRVDKTATVKTYPMSKWRSIYGQKTRKGYRDVTHLAQVVEETIDEASNVSDVKDPIIAQLLQRLQALATGSIRQNYTISSDVVTPAMVGEAQDIVDKLANILDIDKSVAGWRIPAMLLDLYHVIPRRMDNVKNYLPEPNGHVPIADLPRLIATEQANLDVMAQQVSAKTKNSSNDVSKGQSILEKMGLKIAVAEPHEITMVREQAQSNTNQIGKVYQVINVRTQEVFDKQIQKLLKQQVSKARLVTQLYWHGSRNENWLSILDTGLRIRPSGVMTTGAMFGQGIYFADKFKKAFGYTSVRGSYWASGNSNSGFMALFNVRVGKQLDVSRHSVSHYDLNTATLQRKGGYDSVWGKSGPSLLNNEYIIYDAGQCTIAYLVEVN